MNTHSQEHIKTDGLSKCVTPIVWSKLLNRAKNKTTLVTCCSFCVNTTCIVHVSSGSKFRPVSNVMELHAVTLATHSYALLSQLILHNLTCTVTSIEQNYYIPRNVHENFIMSPLSDHSGPFKWSIYLANPSINPAPAHLFTQVSITSFHFVFLVQNWE